MRVVCVCYQRTSRRISINGTSGEVALPLHHFIATIACVPGGINPSLVLARSMIRSKSGCKSPTSRWRARKAAGVRSRTEVESKRTIGLIGDKEDLALATRISPPPHFPSNFSTHRIATSAMASFLISASQPRYISDRSTVIESSNRPCELRD